MPPFVPGPRRRRHAQISGGQPLPLPLVATVGVNNVSATGANVIGSVNPQGLAGSCWFAYGITPQLGSVTATQPLASSSLPQTFSVAVSGLTTGATYYFAVVGQTAAGTVTSAPLQFVAAAPQPVTNPNSLPPLTGTPTISIPHVKFPITFSAAQGIGLVEQDTLEEVFSNVQAIVACPIGACPELPTFGAPELTFGTAPLNPASVIAAIRQWEPRATETAVSQAIGDPNAGSWQIALTTQIGGSGQ